MSYNKNVVEDALFQIKNLEETLQENAKGILQSTMSEEIKQLVKESLKEQDDEIDEPTPDANAPEDMDDDEMAMDDDEMAMDDDEMAMDDDEMAMDDDEMAMDDDEMAMDDDETIDMTDASDDEVLRVFKAMGDEDGIIVKKDGENIHLKDGEDEYMIHLGESDLEDIDIDSEDYFEMDEDMEMDFEDDERIYEIEMDSQEVDEDDDLYGDAEVDFEGNRYGMDEEDSDMVFEIEMDGEEDEMFGGNKHDFHRRHGHKMGDVGGGKYGKGGHYKDYEMEEGVDMYEDMDYEEEDEIEMAEGMDYEEEDKFESVMEAVKKSLKKSVKPKGVGIGSGPKFSYDKKPNMGGGFNTKKKEAFGKGTKAMGTGKAKFEYKEGENMEKGSMKKVETKEAVRTNSYTRANKVGNRKGSNQNVNRQEIRQRPNTRVNESRNNQEVQLLREKNEEYRKALDVFRTKLNEVAVFNSNLAYATRLFTEHSTTKQEKINILRRFDNVESLKESKNLYRSIKNELSTGSSSSEQKINESIERTVNRSVETGSSVNLIESKTYENPQFLRMKDLMGKIK
jgi:hypothetical protein